MRPERFESGATLEEQFQNRETLTIEGERISIVDIVPEREKTVTPVVVAPGWAADPEVLRENILGLAQTGRRTLSLEAPHGLAVEPGSAYDEAELRKALALLEMLEQKKLEKVDVVAHSEGGIYTTLAATMQPEKFRNLVLVNPGGMIGADTKKRLSLDFMADLAKQNWRALLDRKRRPAVRRATWGAVKSFVNSPKKSVAEVDSLASTQIHELLRGLKAKGLGVVIVHSVDDKTFPMDRVQQIAKQDMLDGFYSVQGTHNEFYLDPHKYTLLIDQALDALERQAQANTSTPSQEATS